MDIDFVVQDTYALTRPQWKLATNFDEAGRAFAEAVTQNYKNKEPEKPNEPDAVDDESSSSEEGDDEDLGVPDMEDTHSSSEEVETEVGYFFLHHEVLLTNYEDISERRCETGLRFRRGNNCYTSRRST